jgi:hypothetical protein
MRVSFFWAVFWILDLRKDFDFDSGVLRVPGVAAGEGDLHLAR